MTAHRPERRTRRQFLGRSAALAAGGALGSSAWPAAALRGAPLQDSAALAPAPLAEGETIRMAVIGTGGMGRGHCEAFVEIAKAGRENVAIAAVCDVGRPNLDAAVQTCAAQGFEPDAYGDYRELLARSDVHAVLIAAPEHWHAQMAADAIRAGKDVYCEKPMTLRLEQALALREVVRAHDRVFQVGTQFVAIPMWHQARELIASGAIGHPTCSQTSYCRNSKDGEWLYYTIDPNVIPGQTLDWEAWCGDQGPEPWNPEVYFRWRRYRKWSTGIIGDLLVHKLTPLVMAVDAGWPTRVTASGGHLVDKAMENHDQVNLTIEFEREHTMLVMGSTCNATGIEDLIRGHHGNLFVGGNRLVLRPEQIFAEELDPQTIQCESVGNDQDQHRVDWLGCVRSRQTPRADIELSTQIMVIVDLAARALWEGGTFTFDPRTLTAKRA